MGAAGVADARQSAARRRQPERQTGGADVAGGTGRWRTPRTTRSRGARRAGRGEHVLTAGAHVGGLACGDHERSVRQRREEARGLTSVDGERGRRGLLAADGEEDEDARSARRRSRWRAMEFRVTSWELAQVAVDCGGEARSKGNAAPGSGADVDDDGEGFLRTASARSNDGAASRRRGRGSGRRRRRRAASARRGRGQRAYRLSGGRERVGGLDPDPGVDRGEGSGEQGGEWASWGGGG